MAMVEARPRNSAEIPRRGLLHELFAPIIGIKVSRIGSTDVPESIDNLNLVSPLRTTVHENVWNHLEPALRRLGEGDYEKLDHRTDDILYVRRVIKDLGMEGDLMLGRGVTENRGDGIIAKKPGFTANVEEAKGTKSDGSYGVNGALITVSRDLPKPEPFSGFGVSTKHRT